MNTDSNKTKKITSKTFCEKLINVEKLCGLATHQNESNDGSTNTHSTKGKLAAEENKNIKVKYHFQNEISSFPWLSAS